MQWIVFHMVGEFLLTQEKCENRETQIFTKITFHFTRAHSLVNKISIPDHPLILNIYETLNLKIVVESVLLWFFCCRGACKKSEWSFSLRSERKVIKISGTLINFSPTNNLLLAYLIRRCYWSFC